MRLRPVAERDAAIRELIDAARSADSNLILPDASEALPIVDDPEDAEDSDVIALELAERA